jgi:hypothetical protein
MPGTWTDGGQVLPASIAVAERTSEASLVRTNQVQDSSSNDGEDRERRLRSTNRFSSCLWLVTRAE